MTTGASRSGAPRLVRRQAGSRRLALPVERPRERGGAPNVIGHSKLFVAVLLAVVLGGAALLATPWVTESGDRSGVVDAFFTAVSATAVTGLVTVETQEHWNFWGELVILVLIQLGGLGFMVGASLILLMLRRGQERLDDALLVQNGSPALTLQEASHLSGRIVRFILAVEAVGALLLTVRFAQDRPLGEAVWHGVFHAISAFCNAGFDLQGGYVSLVPYATSPWVNTVIMLLIQAGALSYLVFADLWRVRGWARLALDTKLVLIGNVALLALGTMIFLVAEWNGALAQMAAPWRPMGALFQSVAARTAGFATIGFADAHAGTLFTWIAVMFAGGAAGSTAGGIKLATVGVLVAAVLSTLRGRREVTAYERRIPNDVVLRALAVVAVMLTVHFSLTLLLVAAESLSGAPQVGFLPLMFETMSGLATVGLSTGITPGLSVAGKLVLCLAMLFGRLGPLTVAYALQRRQRPVRYRHAAGAVRIG